MARVFFSYAHEDEGLRDQLEKHLSLLTREGVIETWHDRRIGPGEALADRIDAALETSDIVLLLVSWDFLASATRSMRWRVCWTPRWTTSGCTSSSWPRTH